MLNQRSPRTGEPEGERAPRAPRTHEEDVESAESVETPPEEPAPALDIDPDAHPASRLENLVMQRRARWLLAGAERRILPPLADADGVQEE